MMPLKNAILQCAWYPGIGPLEVDMNIATSGGKGEECRAHLPESLFLSLFACMATAYRNCAAIPHQHD